MGEEKEEKTSQEEISEEEEVVVTDIEDIDAALEKQLAEDKGEEVEDKEERDEANKDEDKDKDGETEEVDDKDKESPDEEEGQEQETDLEKLQKQVDELQADLEKKDDQLKSKEDFIQRQTTEIGNLRKDRTEWREKLKEKLTEKYPGENIDAMVDVVEAHEQEAEKEGEAHGVLVRENEKYVRSQIEDFDNLLDTIADLCVEDGIPKQSVAIFKQNPFTSSPDFLITMANRAKAKIANEKKVTELEAEIKRLKGGAEEVVEKIDKAARQKPKVDHKSGQGSKTEDKETPEISEDDIPGLSDEELKKRLKQSETKI